MLLVGLTLADLLALVLVSLASSIIHSRIAIAENARYESYQLADELRQSSDDLTRMVRTYAATGDPRYEAFFRNILDIRDGKTPRPENYDRIYWDFVTAGLEAPGGPGGPSALEDRMSRAGFTLEEFAKLRKAHANSDGLVALEELAMHAMKGEFEDGRGGFTRSGPPDPVVAQSLVNGERYHAEKARIMRPIDDFIGMIELRTAQRVDKLRKQGWFLNRLSIMLLVPGVIMAGLNLALMKRWILGPLLTLERTANDVGEGRLDVHVPVKRDDEFGQVCRAFNDMASNLRRTTVSKDYLDGILSSMLNTVMVVDAVAGKCGSDAVVRTVNPAVNGLLGRPAASLCGKPLGSVLWDPNGPHPWLNDALSGLPVQGIELSLVSGEGKEVPVLFAASLLAQAGDAASQLVCVAQDLTERRAAEQATRERDKLLRDMNIAREIQRSLLPARRPNIKRYSIAGWSEPADMAGGDYYDWQQLPDGRLLMCIADVSGHGIGAAMLAALCRAYLRSSSAGVDPDIMRMIALRVNNLLACDMSGGRFVTAALALLDAGANQVTLYSAGHGPLFFARARDRSVQSWNANDLPWGVTTLEEAGQPRTVDFEPGDALVLVTDGFFEWSGADGESFGMERLSNAILASLDRPPEELIHALHEEVRKFTKATPQQDDLTAVVIKREA